MGDLQCVPDSIDISSLAEDVDLDAVIKHLEDELDNNCKELPDIARPCKMQEVARCCKKASICMVLPRPIVAPPLGEGQLWVVQRDALWQGTLFG